MRLAEWLLQKRMSRIEFARRIGLTPGAITQLCNSDHAWMSRETAELIAREPRGAVTPNDFLSEAREAGCAIVGTDVDGIPEMLDGGRAGVLVPSGDPDRLAQALIALATDPAELSAWRAKSQINLDHLRIARVAEETLAVYRRAAGLAG